MRAAWYSEYGEARTVLQIGELPDPEPGVGEVRVRVHASGISPTDVYQRSGARRRPWNFPKIVPHQDGAGVIESVGEGVPRERIGERVWLHMAQWQRPHGTAAGFTVIPAERAARLPDNTRHAQGACLGVPAMTAHRIVTLEGKVSGQTVFVPGGAGAVGYYAVQLARSFGARVFASAGNAANAALAQSAGAEAVIDYKNEDVGERIAELTGGQGVDRVLEVDLSANAPSLPKVLKKGGSVIVYGASAPEASFPANWGIGSQACVRFVYVYDTPPAALAQAVADLNRMMDAGELRHLPTREFPLELIASAHEAVERGNHGVRTVVRID
ncbi:MAG: NADPH:quinone reductase [Betaproteobacteria bacterium]|nr:NADPH:quinone reductase [Betaproteobacteria bacterium]